MKIIGNRLANAMLPLFISMKKENYINEKNILNPFEKIRLNNTFGLPPLSA